MINRSFNILTVFLLIFTLCCSQERNYECNFDIDGTNDCQFNLTSGKVNNFELSTGIKLNSNPTQPLSDVTSILSTTSPNNEYCEFPYQDSSENWDMYFCQRYSNTSYTCPTASGVGQCSIGQFAKIRASDGFGVFDQTYTTKVKKHSSTIQCLDFYYYVPDMFNNAKMQVGWKIDTDTEQIVEVIAQPENKWQNSRSNFMSPASSPYELTFRMMRDVSGFSFYFGLDEITIYDKPCDADLTTNAAIEATSMQSTTSSFTTQKPLIELFTCDFTTTLCFKNSELLLTNGSQFSTSHLSEPPRVPLSDVSSVSEPTSNNETCELPYQPRMDNTTNTTSSEIWFCFNNQCPTMNKKIANCTLGYYGFVSINAWESSKTINQSISQDMMMRDLVEEECLQYFYYFTVYEELFLGQQVSVLIKSDNETETEDEIEIDRLSDLDMIENRWHSRRVTFNSTLFNYKLIFRFEVTAANRTENPALNKTIFFALDNVNIYSRNCRAVKKNRLGLILAVSVGVGVSALAMIILGMLIYFKGRKPEIANKDLQFMPLQEISEVSDNDYSTRYVD
ncbi:unnamed protein product [Rotaria magnacalcarata]|uniref:MAM domain-containing protein n=1 Tax=Rotaria magnacalcarata TaxID=392030 RepID=A0A819TXM1_9BILA|nr:unnamed protein product [Rotaria magnacalcarata]